MLCVLLSISFIKLIVLFRVLTSQTFNTLSNSNLTSAISNHAHLVSNSTTAATAVATELKNAKAKLTSIEHIAGTNATGYSSGLWISASTKLLHYSPPRTLLVAAMVFLIYDIMLTFDDEVRLFGASLFPASMNHYSRSNISGRECPVRGRTQTSNWPRNRNPWTPVKFIYFFVRYFAVVLHM
jgi:hypothetical protein